MLRIKNYFLLKGLLFSVLGLVILLRPGQVLTGVIMFFALESLITLLYTIFFLSQQQESTLKTRLIIVAFLQLIWSLIALIFPETVQILLSFLIIIVALVIIGFWYTLIKHARNKKEIWLSNWALFFLTGIVLIFLGIFIAGNSFFTLLTLFSLLWWTTLITGIVYLVQAFKINDSVVLIEPFDDEE